MIIDNLMLEFVHGLNVMASGFFTPFFRFISILGEKSWFFLLIAFLLCLRKKTRWIGITAIGAIGFAWLVGSVILKPIIMRPRPYQSASNLFYQYWVAAGSIVETGNSFPSGHVAGITAFFCSVFICVKKKYKKTIFIIGVISIILMALSRMYFMHHYFTDCLGGFVLGIISALIAKPIAKFIHDLCKRYEYKPFFDFVLNFNILGGDGQ